MGGADSFQVGVDSGKQSRTPVRAEIDTNSNKEKEKQKNNGFLWEIRCVVRVEFSLTIDIYW